MATYCAAVYATEVPFYWSNKIMYRKLFVILLLLALLPRLAGAQQCTTLGQRPETAFPVCGTSTFVQSSVPICTNGEIHVPGCTGLGGAYFDTNPFWYRFTCYKAGYLAFAIKPVNQGDDYDWQLFDITGHSPQDVYTDNSLFVCANWAGTYGNTGASSAGAANVECGSYPPDNVNTFSIMPTLIVGHTYLLMISHFSGDNQSGYGLSFGGGTAVITDTTQPALKTVQTNCPGTKIGIKLTKKMKCSSLAPDGSDFTIAPLLAKVTAVTGNKCNSGFDLDSVVLTLSNPLPAGNYKVIIQNGADQNTLLDNCGNGIPAGDTLPFIITPPKAVDMDSLTPVGCAPKTLQLVFKKNIDCNTIAPNGSDFAITGPYPVTIASAKGVCGPDETSKTVIITLASPVVNKGVYTLHLQKGSDGNTLFDECHEEVPLGETLTFSTNDTVSAAFALDVTHGCTKDVITVTRNSTRGINTWHWLFNDGYTDSVPSVTRAYTDSGAKTVQLIVSNGFCTDSSLQKFTLLGKIRAAFTFPSFLCPNDTAVFKDASTGYVTSWAWYFGNGSSSTLQNPPIQIYPPATRETFYSVELIVKSDVPCSDTVYHKVKVLYNCYIAVPSAFTPNGDGHNDYLYPLNAYKAVNLEFRVFNRWGQQVFETKDWTRKWDGTINGNPQASGVYVWYLTYTNIDTGQKYQQKGTTVLIR